MNLCQAAAAVGVSRQRIHQIAVKKHIGTSTPSKTSGKNQRWEFSQDEVLDMTAEHRVWLETQNPFRVRE